MLELAKSVSCDMSISELENSDLVAMVLNDGKKRRAGRDCKSMKNFPTFV